MYNVKLTCGSIQSRSRWGFIKSTNVSSKFLKRPCWEKIHVHTLINTNDTVLTSYKTDSNRLLIRCVDPFLDFPATVWTRAIKVFCDWLIRAPIFPATFGRANCLIISKPAQLQKWAFGISKPLWVRWRNYWWLASLKTSYIIQICPTTSECTVRLIFEATLALSSIISHWSGESWKWQQSNFL